MNEKNAGFAIHPLGVSSLSLSVFLSSFSPSFSLSLFRFILILTSVCQGKPRIKSYRGARGKTMSREEKERQASMIDFNVHERASVFGRKEHPQVFDQNRKVNYLQRQKEMLFFLHLRLLEKIMVIK